MTGAVGYARVSTDEQARENNSLPVQKERIATFCKQNGWQLLEVFECTESARTMSREGLRGALTYVRDHRKDISHFVVMNLSRLARQVQDQAQLIAMMKQMGINIISIDEPLTDDSSMGNLVRNVLGSMNQFFSDNLSEQTRMRMKAGVKAGRFLWNAPIGYLNRDKAIHPDPERAPLVREAFELVASGRYATTDAVLKVITALGLRTKKGKALTPQTFSRMLRNRIYVGWVVSGDLCERGKHEPLISEDVFNAVQTHLNTSATPHKQLREDFPLRGIVQCAKCGKRLTAGFSKGRNERYSYYWCWNSTCKAIMVRGDDLHRHFVNLLSRMEPTAELLADLPKRIAEQWRERKERIATEARRLTTRRADVLTLNQNAIKLRISGEISAEELDAFKKTNEEELFRIDAEITALDSERTTMEEMLKQAEIDAVDFVATWEKSNVNQRQEFCKAFFPDGLLFGQEKGFFEPANTVIVDMLIRYIEDQKNIGVPDGI